MIVLPFPPASLSGHAGGHWRSKSTPTAKHREWARLATLAAGVTAPSTGDIALYIRFIPPDRRSDRSNFPNRLKAGIDGIAQALGVNDRRFLPSYEFSDPEPPCRVEVRVGPDPQCPGCASPACAVYGRCVFPKPDASDRSAMPREEK